MAKAMYLGVNNVARKVKKIYLGVDGKARKVKKGYIGVGGKARPFFSAEQKAMYYGEITARQGLPVGTYVGNYALFIGSSASNSAYTENLTHVSAPKQNYDTSQAGASCGARAIGFGGTTASFDSNLVHKRLSGGRSVYDRGVMGVRAGNYALIVGGEEPENDDEYESTTDDLKVYDGNGTLTNMSLYNHKAFTATATLAGHGFIMGGDSYYSEYEKFNEVEIYSPNLTRTMSSLASARASGIGASNGEHILVVGGYSDEGSYTSLLTVEAFNTNFVRSTVTSISTDFAKVAVKDKRFGQQGGIGVGECFVFMGGYNDNTKAFCFNKNLMFSELTTINGNHGSSTPYAATSIGNYALFTPSNYVSSAKNVYAYKVD